VIDRARILHSHRPRHGTSLTGAVPVVKRQPGGEEQANLWFDPFRGTDPFTIGACPYFWWHGQAGVYTS
jgi:hypothetical protein